MTEYGLGWVVPACISFVARPGWGSASGCALSVLREGAAELFSGYVWEGERGHLPLYTSRLSPRSPPPQTPDLVSSGPTYWKEMTPAYGTQPSSPSTLIFTRSSVTPPLDPLSSKAMTQHLQPTDPRE